MFIKEPKNISDKLQQFCVSLLVIHAWYKFANAEELGMELELAIISWFVIK